MESLDIALIHPELIYPRGAEKQLAKLAFYLTKSGHNVTIYTFERKRPYIFDNLLEKCNIICLEKPWIVKTRFVNCLRWILLARELAGKISDKHDIINCHNAPAQWVTYFKNIKVPVVWTCNEPPFFSFLFIQTLSPIQELKISILRNLDGELTKNVDKILCLDRKMKKIISEIYKNKHIDVIGSGAELDRKIKHVDNDHVDILFVGPLSMEKRPYDIIEAVGKCKNKAKIRILLIGEDGLMRETILARAKQLEISITLYGNVSDDKLYELYSIADISVFVPSKHPWGIFPLESILAGIPTIISDECGVTEVLTNDMPIVKTGDINQIANLIDDIIENPKEYKKIINKNKIIIKKNYSWRRYSEKMLDIYRKQILKSDVRK